MKITVESTTRIVKADGVECRVWEGFTEHGATVQCLIVRIATPTAEEDLWEFEADLKEHRAPSPDFTPFPLRMIL